jgi:hypothetical protein
MRELRFGDVVEWDTPADPPYTAIRWFIVGGRSGDYRGWWFGGGATQHWADMRRGIKTLGVGRAEDTGHPRILTENDE